MRALTDAEKLVVLAALRQMQDGDIDTERAWRIMTLEKSSVEATRIFVDKDAMDELWDLLNENPITVGTPRKSTRRKKKE